MHLANKEEISIIYIRFPQGHTGEQFVARKERPFIPSIFLVRELEVLEKVYSEFKTRPTIEIIELSHMEVAWKENKNDKGIISYEYAFQLNQI